MPTILATVDSTTVKFNTFTYAINANFNGLTDPISSAKITTFVPSYITYTMPPIVPPLQDIIANPVAGGTQLIFDFGAINDLGQTIVIYFGMNFNKGTPNGTTYTAQFDLNIDGTTTTSIAPTVTLTLVPQWVLEKSMAIPSNNQPAQGGTAYYLLRLRNLGDAGATITNVTITDNMGTGMSVDSNYTPIGRDNSYTDPSEDGPGSIIGNSVRFTLNDYYGTDYYMIYKVLFDPAYGSGSNLTNTVDWSINGTPQQSVTATTTITDRYNSQGIGKSGPQTSKAGNLISYELYMSNWGNNELINPYVIDVIPDDITLTKLFPGSFIIPVINVYPNQQFTITYELDHSGIFNFLGTYPYNDGGNYWNYVDLTGLGGKVTALRWDFPVVAVGLTQANAPRLEGVISASTTATQITNPVTAYYNDVNGNPQSYTVNMTTLLNGVAMPEGSKGNSPTGNVSPGDIIKYTLSMGGGLSPIDNPVLADLLPPEVEYVGNVVVNYYDYFSNYASAPITITSTDIIPNFDNTGRTLVRFHMDGQQIHQRSTVYLDFEVRVKVGATGTITNAGYLGNNGQTQVASWYPSDNVYPDVNDVDGDGNTNESLFLTNKVSNSINFATSLATDKKVLGQLDTVYTQTPQVGLTVEGGSVKYKLTISNIGNVTIESFELVDILPHIGDTGVVLDTTARGSMFPVYITGALSAALSPAFPGDPTPVFDIQYSGSYDPVRFDNYGTGTIGTVNDWSSTPPALWTDVKSIKLITNNTKIRPGQSLVIDLDCLAAVGVTPNLVAWNSYALTATYTDQGGNPARLLSVEPEKVGVQVLQDTSKVAIGNYVWLDANGNGLQDSNEVGVNGVRVNLYDSTGNTKLATTITAFDINNNPGYYLFNNLDPGCYIVEFVLPSGYIFTRQLQGSDPTIDSNVNPVIGRTAQVCVTTPGTSDLTVDAGIVQPAQVGDFVWEDTNKNGVADSGESGIPNVTATLYYCDGTSTGLSATTDANGFYHITNVLPGSYYVVFTGIPTNYEFITVGNLVDATGRYVDKITGLPACFTVNPGDAIEYVDAPIATIPLGVGNVGDYVWVDTNKDGIQDGTEVGMAGVTVTLYDCATNQPTTYTATTDATGHYLITGVVEGSYYAVFTGIPTGYEFVTAGNYVDINGKTACFNVVANSSVLTVDAPIVSLPAQVGDFVWDDVNRNGVIDASESGVGGVTATLYQCNGTSTGLSAVTDSNGFYHITNVLPGSYYMVFTGIPAGYEFVTTGNYVDAAGRYVDKTTGLPACFTVNAGDVIEYVDAPIATIPLGVGNVGDYVWVDTNKDGIQDGTEVGMAGVTVTLYDCATNQPTTYTATTDATGHYLITGVVEGSYYAVFTGIPAGYEFVTAGNYVDINGKTACFNVVASSSILTVDAPIVPLPAQIGDYVWVDLNRDGVEDAGESGVLGVTATLYNCNGTSTGLSAVTDSNGFYHITNVPAGNYYVVFSGIPANYEFVTAGNYVDATGRYVDKVTGLPACFTVNPGDVIETIDAPIAPLPASVGDYVWVDANRDGVQDGTELGVSGITVTLYNCDGTPTGLSAMTDANGLYQIDNVLPGSYYVFFTGVPAGYEFVLTGNYVDATGRYVDKVTGLHACFTVNPGDVITTVDAPIALIPPDVGNVGNYVWIDLNRDGIQDATEVGVAGVTVTLYDCITNAPTTYTEVTDSAGAYLITGVPAGSYYAVFTGLPTGYEFITAGNYVDATGKSNCFEVVGSQEILTVDAPIAPIFATVGDYVWIDSNRDGIQDGSESGVAGVTATLYHCDDTPTGLSAVTDSNGYYHITNVPAGSYYMVFTGIPAGYEFVLAGGYVDATGRRPGCFQVNAGDAIEYVDAPIAPMVGSVGDYVWVDMNRDGVQDATEVGVPGVTVTLYDCVTNQPTAYTAVTDANGAYLITDVLAGSYYAVFTGIPQNYEFVTAGGYVDATGTTRCFEVVGNTSILTVDAPIAPKPAQVGDYVWIDSNRDGIQDANESGVAGVTATLYHCDGTPTGLSAVTDSNGIYHITNVMPGDYYMVFTGVPASYEFVTAGNYVDATGRYVDSLTGMPACFTVNAGDMIESIDAPIAPLLGNVGDYVWVDLNRDGIQDATEVGVPNVTVRLYDCKTQQPTSYMAVTDANGGYLITDVLAGSYYAVFTGIPQNYEFVTAGGYIDATGTTNCFEVVGNTSILTVDAPIAPKPAQVGDYVWVDSNKDGIEDANESGIAGVTATLYNCNGTPTGLSAVTDANGIYHIMNVLPGDYYVIFTGIPASYEFVTAGNLVDATGRYVDPVTGMPACFTVNAGDMIESIDAPIAPKPAQVGDYVWIDSNRDGIQDATEVGVPGVTATLYHCDGIPTDLSAVTDSDGYYHIMNVMPGDYYVVFTDIPAKYRFLTAGNLVDITGRYVDPVTGMPACFTVNAGDVIERIDAPIAPIVANVGDYVWIDSNRDGIQDATELGVPNVTITLYDCATNQPTSYTAVTDMNGRYLIKDVVVGSYYAVFTNIPKEYEFVTANNYVDTIGKSACFTVRANQTAVVQNILVIDAPIAAKAPEVELVKASIEKEVVGGDVIHYSLTITNLGITRLESVIVKDLLDSKIEFIKGSVKVDGVARPEDSILAGIEVGPLEAGKKKQITFEAKVIDCKSGKDIINQATAYYTFELDGQIQPGTVQSNENIVAVKCASLTVEKSTTTDECVSLGDTIVYTSKVTNTGDIEAFGIIYKDELPKEVQLVDNSVKVGTHVLRNVDLDKGINIGSLKPGESIEISYAVKVMNAPCNGILMNRAYATFKYTLEQGNGGTQVSNIAEVQVCTNIQIFKQMAIDSMLQIPVQKPDVEHLDHVSAQVLINDIHVIQTAKAYSQEGQNLSGYKLIVHGQIEVSIEYTALEETQTVHSAHYTIPFSTFLVLPATYEVGQKIEVKGQVEDAQAHMLSIREFVVNIVALISANIL